MLFVPVIDLRVKTAADRRRVDLDGLFEQKPMVIDSILGLEKIRDVKGLHDRLSIRGVDVNVTSKLLTD